MLALPVPLGGDQLRQGHGRDVELAALGRADVAAVQLDGEAAVLGDHRHVLVEPLGLLARLDEAFCTLASWAARRMRGAIRAMGTAGALRKETVAAILTTMADEILTPRDLNRILLARQMLLDSPRRSARVEAPAAPVRRPGPDAPRALHRPVGAAGGLPARGPAEGHP